jgi:N,N-dimethylformamidase
LLPPVTDQYGGIEFHDDAIIDCNWERTKQFVVPDLRSGAYAIRPRIDDEKDLREEYVVFFVRPRKPKAPIQLLIPTGAIWLTPMNI